MTRSSRWTWERSLQRRGTGILSWSWTCGWYLYRWSSHQYLPDSGSLLPPQIQAFWESRPRSGNQKQKPNDPTQLRIPAIPSRQTDEPEKKHTFHWARLWIQKKAIWNWNRIWRLNSLPAAGSDIYPASFQSPVPHQEKHNIFLLSDARPHIWSPCRHPAVKPSCAYFQIPEKKRSLFCPEYAEPTASG